MVSASGDVNDRGKPFHPHQLIATNPLLTLLMDVATCPYCLALLPTSKAQQCLDCGWDWHDARNPVRRGSPHFNRFGIDTTKSYAVVLCQCKDGRRYYEFSIVDEAVSNPDAVLRSETLTGSDLVSWVKGGKCDHLRLTSGERFAFDSHGIWLTYSEIKQMRDRSNSYWEGDQSFWVNGIAPLFPPA